jgi:hypothetical protein
VRRGGQRRHAARRTTGGAGAGWQDVRGASAHGELVHLVSLVQHACGLVYDQVKASVKMHERRAAEVIFGRNDLRHTDYDHRAAFTVLPPHGSWEQEYWQYEAVTVAYYGHGRTELLTLESTTALNSYLPFPGIAQVVRRTRWVWSTAAARRRSLSSNSSPASVGTASPWTRSKSSAVATGPSRTSPTTLGMRALLKTVPPSAPAMPRKP